MPGGPSGHLFARQGRAFAGRLAALSVRRRSTPGRARLPGLSLPDALCSGWIWPMSYFRRLAALELQDVEPVVAIAEIDEAALVHVHVVALRTGLAGRRLGNVVACFARRRGVRDVDDAQPAGKPCAVDERIAALHMLLELMRAEAARRGTAPRGIELAHLVDRERLDFPEIRHVEYPQAAVQAPAPARHLFLAVRVVFLVDRDSDLPAIDRRHAHEGMRRLGERRVVVVLAYRLRLADVGDVDDAHASVPAAGPHAVTLPQRVVQPVLAAWPRRFLAAVEVLPRHPPARHFRRLGRVADVVDHQN